MESSTFLGVELPEEFNLADYLLDARIREGCGKRPAIRTEDRILDYSQVQEMANTFGNVLRSLGVEQENRVIISLPDIPEFAAALFGVLKIGAVVVMVNPQLKRDDISYFLDYTRARVAIVSGENLEVFQSAAVDSVHLKRILTVKTNTIGSDRVIRFEDVQYKAGSNLQNATTNRDDPAIWLFSGGTTGKPKAVVQTHQSFANTTVCYGQKHLGYSENDVTISVPKLFFGYATGSNLFFPFSMGASCVLFPERCTAEEIFRQIQRHQPTILINVPTMVNQMVSHPEANQQDLSRIRFATSAGEALPVELYERWKQTFGVELLDGLGTAEMWHIFISNKPGSVKPGTVGTVVPGFQVKVADDEGVEVSDGEIGMCWVKGRSRAISYWQMMEKTASAFRGEWYVTGDLLKRDAEGYFTHCGRGDDMMKVSGKWVSPLEVENCLLKHVSVRECAVVPLTEASGLTKPCAFVVASAVHDSLADELKLFVKENLEPYKYPRHVVFVETLPRTHLGKVDRALLKRKTGDGLRK